MMGAATASIVSVLQFLSKAEDQQAYLLWTFGSLGSLSWVEIQILFLIVIAGLLIGTLSVKSLNAWLLGDNYARSIGIKISQSRLLIILSTAILTGGVTAFCGPIAFVGLAVPHLTKLMIKTHNHRDSPSSGYDKRSHTDAFLRYHRAASGKFICASYQCNYSFNRCAGSYLDCVESKTSVYIIMEKDLVKTCIETLGLTVGYKHNALLQDLSLNLNAGELVCFMGPNGVGKSTLIRTLAGLQSPLSGQITYKTSESQNPDDLPRQLAVVLTDRITAGNMTASGRNFLWPLSLSELDRPA